MLLDSRDGDFLDVRPKCSRESMAARARDARLVLRSRCGGESFVMGGEGPKANGATRSMSAEGGKECDGAVD